MISRGKRVETAVSVYPKFKELFLGFAEELKNKPPKEGFYKIVVEEINETLIKLTVFDNIIEISLSIAYLEDKTIGKMTFEQLLREDEYKLIGFIFFDMNGDILKFPDNYTEFHSIPSIFRVESIVIELLDQFIRQSSPIII